jgi:hypothetical protein
MPGLSEIAVGVPVLSRSEALAQFIESVPAGVSRVIVADNGLPGEHTHVYGRDWHVDIDVLDLEHDIGIAACRAALTGAVTEPYLWMGDCDMEFVDGRRDLARLREILDSDAQLGGVSGWLVEGDVVRSAARDLHVVGSTVIKRGDSPDVVHDPHPHARFDFIPQCGLFRRAAYQTYDYDPAVNTYEHSDFFLGHKDRGRWAFASTPTVQILHHRDIDPEYREQHGQHNAGSERLAEKWGVERTATESVSEWAQLYDRSVPEDAFDLFRRATPARVWLPVRRMLKRAGLG